MHDQSEPGYFVAAMNSGTCPIAAAGHGPAVQLVPEAEPCRPRNRLRRDPAMQPAYCVFISGKSERARSRLVLSGAGGTVPRPHRAPAPKGDRSVITAIVIEIQ